MSTDTTNEADKDQSTTAETAAEATTETAAETTTETVTETIEKKKVIVSIDWDSYNQRRYSKPWIGKITKWDIGQNPNIEWGGYVGDDNGGMTEISAFEGDIIRYGQKDHRGNNTCNCWAIVDADGDIDNVTPVQARKHFFKQ